MQTTNEFSLPSFRLFPISAPLSRILYALQFQKCRDSTRTQTLLNIEKLYALPKRPCHARRFTYIYVSPHISLSACIRDNACKISRSDTDSAISLWRELERVFSRSVNKKLCTTIVRTKCKMLHMQYEQTL